MIVKTMRRNMRLIVRAYSKATGQTEAAISRELYGTSGFLRAFYAGEKTISLDKYERMISRIVARWPESAAWPKVNPVVFQEPGIKLPRESRVSA